MRAWTGLCVGILVAATAQGVAAQTATGGGQVEVTNLLEEIRVRLVNPPDRDDSLSVAVNHTGDSATSPTALVVPTDQYFILTDIDVVHVSPPGEYAVADGSGPQLFLRIEEPMVRSYRSGVVFGPGERVTVQSATDARARFAFRGTLMGRLEPLE